MMNAPTEAVALSPGQQLAALNARGQYRQALKLAAALEHDLSGKVQTFEADFWLQRALAYELVPSDGSKFAQRYYTAAEQAPGYTRLLHGDALRDIAAELIRRDKRPLHRVKLLDFAERLHQGDVVRTAAIIMVRGRLQFAQREYAEALKSHAMADMTWQDLDGATKDQFEQNPTAQQWARENKFYLFRVFCVLKDDESVNLHRLHVEMDNASGLGPVWRIRQHLLYNASGRLAPVIDHILEKYIRL